MFVARTIAQIEKSAHPVKLGASCRNSDLFSDTDRQVLRVCIAAIFE
jgi:hypothetical protein